MSYKKVKRYAMYLGESVEHLGREGDVEPLGELGESFAVLAGESGDFQVHSG